MGGAGTGGKGGAGGVSGCPTTLEGWATVNANGVNGTTGGGSATRVTVTTFAELSAAVAGNTARVIVVSGTIRTTDGGGSALRIGSNKTLLGADRNATIYGGIEMNGVSNVIVRNLNFHGIWPNSGPDDTIASRNSHHIWYDHLNVWDAGDGMLDITNQSDYQTVSWSKFWYTDATHDHRLASLNGSGGGDHPEDEGYLRVTYHHNWWAERVDQRMPRVMYGDGHQYNNFFNSPGNGYCIGVGSYGSVLIENNYFKEVKDPHIFMYALWSHATARGNVYDNTTGARASGYGGNSGEYQPAPFTDPPYDYAMDPAANVPDLVTRYAGPR
jgi:pectate lyase